jgi:hypothetical protein
MDDQFLVQGIIVFLPKVNTKWISSIDKHLLILDGHESHVTLIAFEQAQSFGLNMINLPSHIIHAL